jgi:DNA-binding HxlR family transcriptional regulator
VPEMPDAAILRLTGDFRVRSMLGALAEGPLHPAELQRRTGISRETLYNRLHELTEIHMVSSSRSSNFPFTVRCEFTRVGRVAYAKALLMAREQRRVLMPEHANGGDGINELLRLLSPVLRLYTPQQGRCLLVERHPSGEALQAYVLADERRITVLERPSTGPSHATVEGTASAWDSALTRRELHGLEIEGDRALAQAVLDALLTALGPLMTAASCATVSTRHLAPFEQTSRSWDRPRKLYVRRPRGEAIRRNAW